MESIADFNKYLHELREEYDLEIGIADDFQRLVRELHGMYAETETVIQSGLQPLSPPMYQVRIYYPVSRGELPLQKVEYASTSPITPADLINSIASVYKERLTEENIQAYIDLSPDYNTLRDSFFRISFIGGPRLRDVIKGDRLHALEPYEDGYLVQLS